MIKKACYTICIVIILLSAPLSGNAAAEPDAVPETYPMALANIPLDLPDHELVRLYGRGYYTPMEPHTGGVYYIDVNQTLTLHVGYGAGFFVETITLSRGMNIPEELRRSDIPPWSITVRELKDAMLEAWGTTPEAVMKRFGKPFKDKTEGGKRTLIYTNTKGDARNSSCEAAYEAYFEFKGDRIDSITIHCGC